MVWGLKTAAFGVALLPAIEAGWRYAGGGSFVFHSLKTFVFGKTLKTKEYPDGPLITVTLRFNTLKSLFTAIAKSQPPLYPGVEFEPGDVKGLYRWTAPHFIEKLTKAADLRLVSEGGWILWTREDIELPATGITLDKKDKENKSVDHVIIFLSQLRVHHNPLARISQAEEDALISELLMGEEAPVTLWRNFHGNPPAFVHHVRRWMGRKGVVLPISSSSFLEAQLDSQKAKNQGVSEEDPRTPREGKNGEKPLVTERRRIKTASPSPASHPSTISSLPSSEDGKQREMPAHVTVNLQ